MTKDNLNGKYKYIYSWIAVLKTTISPKFLLIVIFWGGFVYLWYQIPQIPQILQIPEIPQVPGSQPPQVPGSQIPQRSGFLTHFFQGIISILAAFAGTVWSKQYIEYNGNKSLNDKGRSVIRNLKSIRSLVEDLRNWNKKEINISSEESIRHLKTLRNKINSAMEDWDDVSPELQSQNKAGQEIDDLEEGHRNQLLVLESKSPESKDGQKALKKDLKRSNKRS